MTCALCTVDALPADAVLGVSLLRFIAMVCIFGAAVSGGVIRILYAVTPKADDYRYLHTTISVRGMKITQTVAVIIGLVLRGVCARACRGRDPCALCVAQLSVILAFRVGEATTGSFWSVTSLTTSWWCLLRMFFAFVVICASFLLDAHPSFRHWVRRVADSAR